MVALGLLGELYFSFAFDANEPGGTNVPIQLDGFSITVGTTTVWAMTDQILLNPASLTQTQGGNSKNSIDMALYIPVSAFNGNGFTGATQFIPLRPFGARRARARTTGR